MLQYPYMTSLNYQHDVPLSTLTTMKLGGPAANVIEINDLEQLRQAVTETKARNQRILVLGGGSNTVAHDEGFAGTILLNKISGFEVVDETDSYTTVKVGGGEVWDSVVERSVDMNLSGIECLSAIPGSAGAAPVQNIGAYGQELADVFVELTAYDLETQKFITLDKPNCHFGYRSSIFRTTDIGRYFITSITLRLSKLPPQPPFYQSVQQALDESGEKSPNSKILRQIVSKIRADKLPDPSIWPNSGSFFKNAMVSTDKFAALQRDYTGLPHYQIDDQTVKIPTGWLIEQTGLKGQTLNGIKIHDRNALVLINQSATSYNDLAHTRDHIITTVRNKFGITIEQEPLEIQ